MDVLRHIPRKPGRAVPAMVFWKLFVAIPWSWVSHFEPWSFEATSRCRPDSGYFSECYVVFEMLVRISCHLCSYYTLQLLDLVYFGVITRSPFNPIFPLKGSKKPSMDGLSGFFGPSIDPGFFFDPCFFFESTRNPSMDLFFCRPDFFFF